jgi:hypothetical protein
MAPVDPHAEFHDTILRRSTINYLTWPLWAQILMVVGMVTFWIPVYFVVELCKECSCAGSRKRNGQTRDGKSLV